MDVCFLLLVVIGCRRYWEPQNMTEEEKQALRNSFAGKSVSQMTPDERKVFDEDFQYGFGNKPSIKPSGSKNLPALI